MEWIERKRRWLWLAEGIGVLAAISILVALKKNGAMDMAPWQVGVVVLPWLLMFLAGAPLLYLSWFRDKSSSISTHVLKAAFWVFVSVGFFVFAGIYGTFVFHLW
jgi:hypothetical protein